MKIAITGGIGAGKSMVIRLLKDMAFPVYDADLRSKFLCDNNFQLRSQLIAVFGEAIYDNNILQKTVFASLIFDNPSLLQKANSIIHPFVALDLSSWAAENSRYKAIFTESAILYESGFDQYVDKVVVVTAPEEMRIERVMQRSAVTHDELRARLNNQLPESEKIKRADFVINNDNRPLIPQVNEMLHFFHLSSF